MHPILKHLKRHDTTQAKFARLMGVTPQHLCDVLHGRSFFGRKNSRRVVKVSGGEVTLEALLAWQPRRKGKRSGR